MFVTAPKLSDPEGCRLWDIQVIQAQFEPQLPFSDQEDHAGGQSHLGDWCEVCPQTHGPDAGHLLCRWGGEDLRGSGCDEPEPVVSAAWDLLQAQLQLHLVEPFKVCGLNGLKCNFNDI